MTDLQKGLLDLLKEIDVICRKYGIEYYLGGGTFVGAVRHGCFLPWDDDADIHMSRENSDKFIAAVKKENKANRDIYYAPFGGGFRATLLRYENTASTTYMRSLVGRELLKGQYVDIFINYPLPMNEKKATSYIDGYKMYSELRRQDNALMALRTNQFLRKYQFLVKIRRIIGTEKLMGLFEKRIFTYPEEKTEKWFIGSPGLERKVTFKALWGKPHYIPFEDTMLPVAEHAEKVLSNAYGPTWFEVPAYTERGSHAFVTDMEIPYTVYDVDIDKRFDAKQYVTDRINKKEYLFSLLHDRNFALPRLRQMQGICMALELQNRIESAGINLDLLIREGREEEIKQLFLSYFELQSTVPFKYYGIYIDMPDEYLHAAVYFQCFNGRYGIAKKVLGMRRTRVTRALSPNLQRLCDLCDATDNLLTTLYGDLDMQAARAIVDEWLDKEPTALYFLRADIYLRLNGFGAESDEELLRRCDRYREQYADDGELLKYCGDLLLRLGDREEGERCYRKALCSLRNGFCIRAIKEYFGEGRQLEVVE